MLFVRILRGSLSVSSRDELPHGSMFTQTLRFSTIIIQVPSDTHDWSCEYRSANIFKPFFILVDLSRIKFADIRKITDETVTLFRSRHHRVHLLLRSRLPIIPADTQNSHISSIHGSLLRAKYGPTSSLPPSGIPSSSLRQHWADLTRNS